MFYSTGAPTYRRRDSFIRMHSMTVEAPITKVIDIRSPDTTLVWPSIFYVLFRYLMAGTRLQSQPFVVQARLSDARPYDETDCILFCNGPFHVQWFLSYKGH